MKDSGPNIAVSGINATDSPGPGVGVIRSIRASRGFAGEVTGLAYDPLDPGIYMRGICDQAYLLPYPSSGSGALLERLREIHRETPIDAVLPCLDAELPAFLSIEKELSKMGIKSFLPTREGLSLMSKEKLGGLAEKGVRTPRCVPLYDASAIWSLDKSFDFPVMVKGRFYGASLCRNPGEVERAFARFAGEWGTPVLVQDYVRGEEYDVMALGDGEGGMLGAVPMKKMQLTDAGKAWGGITVRDPELSRFADEAMEKIRWRGPCELEMVKSFDDGRFYLIELNPRFPAWCYLGAAAGPNLPWAAVRLALGEKVEALPATEPGVMFLRHSLDKVYPLAEYQELSLSGKVRHPAGQAGGESGFCDAI